MMVEFEVRFIYLTHCAETSITPFNATHKLTHKLSSEEKQKGKLVDYSPYSRDFLAVTINHQLFPP